MTEIVFLIDMLLVLLNGLVKDMVSSKEEGVRGQEGHATSP